MNKIYNLNTFEQLISDILKHGYQFITEPSELVTGNGKIYLRHDIDVCLIRAYKILEIEKRIGAESTFFFMVNSPFYNLSEFNNLSLIKLFIDQRAKIGLHAYILDIEKFEEEIELQQKILNMHFETNINQLSFHHPNEKSMELDLTHVGLENLYHFCKKSGIEYFSDSNMNLNFIDLYQALRDKKNIQLLLHPVWWIESLNDPSDLWEILLGEASAKLRRNIQRTERTYIDGEPNRNSNFT